MRFSHSSASSRTQRNPQTLGVDPAQDSSTAGHQWEANRIMELQKAQDNALQAVREEYLRQETKYTEDRKCLIAQHGKLIDELRRQQAEEASTAALQAQAAKEREAGLQAQLEAQIQANEKLRAQVEKLQHQLEMEENRRKQAEQQEAARTELREQLQAQQKEQEKRFAELEAEQEAAAKQERERQIKEHARQIEEARLKQAEQEKAASIAAQKLQAQREADEKLQAQREAEWEAERKRTMEEHNARMREQQAKAEAVVYEKAKRIAALKSGVAEQEAHIVERMKLPPCDGIPLPAEEKEKIRRETPFLDQIKNNIAIVGNAGTGKSTLINGIMQCGGVPNPAPAVTGEPTREVKAYDAGPTVMLIDCPGCGMVDHPFPTYVQTFHLKAMDAVIILTATRLLEDELQLYKVLSESGVKVFVARNKMDVDLSNELRPLWDQYGVTADRELPSEVVIRVSKELGAKVRGHMRQEGVERAFLVSAINYTARHTYPPAVSFDEMSLFDEVISAVADRAPELNADPGEEA